MRSWAFPGGFYCLRGRFSPRKPSSVRVCSSERLILVEAIPCGDFLPLGGSGRGLRGAVHCNQTDGSKREPRNSGAVNETEFHFSLPPFHNVPPFGICQPYSYDPQGI